MNIYVARRSKSAGRSSNCVGVILIHQRGPADNPGQLTGNLFCSFNFFYAAVRSRSGEKKDVTFPLRAVVAD
jgi:hypothetical protein